MKLFAISYLGKSITTTTHGVIVALDTTQESAELFARQTLATMPSLFGYAIYLTTVQVSDINIIEAYKGLNNGSQT